MQQDERVTLVDEQHLQGKVPLMTDGGTAQSDAESLPPPRATPFRGAILAVLPIFMGYSTLVSFQSKLKDRLGITDTHSDASYIFGDATSLIFLGNLLFRLLHNVIFTAIRPRNRVLISYITMSFSLFLVTTVVLVAGSTSLVPIFFSYIAAGVGIGCFEANLLSCITPLGHDTKKWAVLGMPFGYNGMSIIGFLIFYITDLVTPSAAVGVQAGVFYFTLAANLFGIWFFVARVPDIAFEASQDTLLTWLKDFRHFKTWFPPMWAYFMALFVDMFTVILVSSIMQYIFNVPEVPLWPGSSYTIEKNLLQLVLNIGGLVGDAGSRVVAYSPRATRVHPFFYLILSGAALGLAFSKVALLAPLSQILALFANGGIYASTTKRVDTIIDKKYNLIVLSLWLFAGDLGSFIAANAVSPLLAKVGTVELAGTLAPLVFNGTSTPTGQ
jgi:hypothetical protein